MESKDININLYGIFLIKKYLEVNEKNDEALNLLVGQLNSEYILLLISLFNKNNKKLNYNLLYILINVGYFQKGEELFISDENILLNIATFLGKNKNDSKLLINGIWLLRNITCNKNICQILINYKIIDFFEEIYERNLINEEFMRALINCICNIINYKLLLKEQKQNNDPSCLLPSIKIIRTQLRLTLPSKLLYKCVNILFNLMLFNSIDVLYAMIDNKIHKELMALYRQIIEKIEEIKNKINEYEANKKNNNINNSQIEQIEGYKNDLTYYNFIILLILKILGKLMSLEDNILTQNLLDSGISQFLNFVLQSHDPKVIKNAFFCLSNICSGTYGQLAYLYDNNTFIEAIKVAKYIYEALDFNSKSKNEYYGTLVDVFREINYVFSLAINNSIKEKFIPLARYDNYAIVVILSKGLDILSDKNIEHLNDYILAALYKLILFDKDDFINSNDNDKYIRFSEVMEKNGLKECLEKIIANEKNHQDIIKNVELIYDSLFK